MISPTLSRALRAARALPVLTTAAVGFLLAGCGPSAGSGRGDGKSVNTAARRQSEFDFYCDLRPISGAGDVSKGRGYQPFAPTVYAAMRARGYKVYLVSYRWRRPGDPFYPVSATLLPGYGLRNFFGAAARDMAATQIAARSAEANNNARVGSRTNGYGLRNLFGFDDEGAHGMREASGTRTAVVWETSRGEFFLVDHYYASPVWLDGSTWLDRVRFFDPSTVAVDVVKS